MTTHTCKVDNQGRVTLPAEWREREKVKGGSEVVVILDEHGLQIQTARQSLDESQRIIARHRRPGMKSPVDLLLAERQREADLDEKASKR